MSGKFGPQPSHGDDIIRGTLAKSKKAEDVLRAVCDDPQIRAAVQHAIDNPPPTKSKDGAPIMGGRPPEWGVRQALVDALGAND
jgi:hypothetical protein